MAEGKEILTESTWMVARTGMIQEYHFWNGEIKWRVTVWDEGRKPFISKWFNSPSSAADFLEKVREPYAEDVGSTGGDEQPTQEPTVG